MALGQRERAVGSERPVFRDVLVPEGDFLREFPFLEEWAQGSVSTRGYVRGKELLPTVEDTIQTHGGLLSVRRHLKGATDEEIVLQACRLAPMTALEISRFGQIALDGERLPREAIYKKVDPQGPGRLRFLLPDVHRAIARILSNPDADVVLEQFDDIVYLEKAPRFGDIQYWTIGGRIGYLTVGAKQQPPDF